jgi:ubiquinone/menaquinone biosynthesis C-methylase UbiE
MLALARKRRGGRTDADFIVADAQQHPLPSAHFDWIQSRLGVMFFEDTEAAFANLHRAARRAPGCVSSPGAAQTRTRS